jgi:hypothetical protein
LQFRDREIPNWKASPLTQAVHGEWWEIISRNDYQVASLQTLRDMWEGAASMLSGKA